MAVAWACEAHNALQTELATFHQKRRQMLFAARNFELLAEEADMKLQSVKQQVDMLIRTALDQVSVPKVAQEQRYSQASYVQEIPRPGCFGTNNYFIFSVTAADSIHLQTTWLVPSVLGEALTLFITFIRSVYQSHKDNRWILISHQVTVPVWCMLYD